MKSAPTSNPPVRNINKPAYVIFVLAGIYFMIARDFSQASVFLGFALVFDPFDVNQPFQKRPLYQKTVLYVHMAITIALFIAMLLGK